MLRSLMTTTTILAAGLGLAASLGWHGPAHADAAADNRTKVNQHVVGIMAGRPGSADLDLAYELDSALSDGYDLRVVPMVSQGSAREFEDLLYLRGVDMAIVQRDVIEFIEQNAIYPNTKKAVRLISPLAMDQFHLLAGTNYRTIYDLAGQKVNFNRSESGTSLTASVIFDALGIPVEVTNYEHNVAFEHLRKGEIAAMARASAAPTSPFDNIRAGEPFHLLEVPPTGALGDIYKGVTLTSDQYPGLIAPGEEIVTVGVATILISYNWPKGHPRGETLAVFADRFLQNYDKLLQTGYHEAWQNLDISEDVPGLERHWAVEAAMRKFTGNPTF